MSHSSPGTSDRPSPIGVRVFVRTCSHLFSRNLRSHTEPRHYFGKAHTDPSCKTPMASIYLPSTAIPASPSHTHPRSKRPPPPCPPPPMRPPVAGNTDADDCDVAFFGPVFEKARALADRAASLDAAILAESACRPGPGAPPLPPDPRHPTNPLLHPPNSPRAIPRCQTEAVGEDSQ